MLRQGVHSRLVFSIDDQRWNVSTDYRQEVGSHRVDRAHVHMRSQYAEKCYEIQLLDGLVCGVDV